MVDPLLLFYVILRATLLSTGGTGNLPALHHELVTVRGWATSQQVAEAVGIGQIAPGPTGLWVISLGYFVDGIRGGLIAALAVALPPLMVLFLARLYAKNRHHPPIEGFVRGLALTVTALGTIIMCRLLSAGGSLTIRAIVIAIAGGALMASRRVPVIVILLLGAFAGFLWK